MDEDVSESDFEFISHDFLRSWYLRDGKKRIPILNQAHTKEMKEEGKMQTPLQLIALIHRGHSIIHKPWWPRVFLPILCPTSLALEEMYKHWFYSTKRDEGHVHKFSLASMKMAFHLGYTIQVFWILTTKRPLGPLPTAANPEPTTNFFDSDLNIRYLAKFFGKLWLKLWKQRRGVIDPDSMQPELWSSWTTSKGSMPDNWRDLEGALATLWRIFTHEKEEVPKKET
ncbi:hypothetical protein NCU09645 [Neurospora crassa OR74A]|uniref:Uncharacterized protein n=1 Tax=Neurospora crassa (strain ATCC 24698 / 74-OR23-1A / CBS 708.71 / DSM 1257 / FGSC 987) TaxID=367110 RepID=Q7S278_NEUCR|nr:hypothetical protein NCU09645 [Neurospora crassa OR74A]EAA29475.2 hypothetical protein NCU09645 [Neurospora crassa OR74A]|eukprot:XP_958711.2 hypothetical protein NCU09645 [Neurospora crassa OR74A]